MLHIALLRRLFENGALKNRNEAKNEEDVAQENLAKRRTWSEMVSGEILHYISL